MKKYMMLLAAVSLAACSPQPPAAPAAVSEAGVPAAVSQPAADGAHPGRDVLDWAGTYRGTLPCGSCEGIETELVLGQDGGYRLVETYLEREPVRTEVSGRFEWLADGSRIRLDEAGDGRYYLVAENRLLSLDNEGKRLEGEMADRYLLQKAEAP
ncbi:MAG: copper resistance protein NlpE [Eikenella sp.]|nr:copper resistance protein NlpE [Eikenella sp.]